MSWYKKDNKKRSNVQPNCSLATGNAMAVEKCKTVDGLPVYTSLEYQTVNFDSHGMFSTDQPTKLTCKEAGIYSVSASAWMENLGGNSVHIRILLNGEIIAQAHDEMASDDAFIGVYGLAKMAEGDYLEACVCQWSSSSKSCLPKTFTAVKVSD